MLDGSCNKETLATSLITYEEIAEAACTLRGAVHRTSVLTSRAANDRTGADFFFACEDSQRTGSFRFRGVYNALARLPETQKRLGVACAWPYLHAQATAIAAQMLSIPSIAVVPSDTPITKIEHLRECNAQIILWEHFESPGAIVTELTKKLGWTFIPPEDHRDIIAGQGTIAKELIETVGPLDHLFVLSGGSGLLAGSALAAAHLSPQCVVLGVQGQTHQELHEGTFIPAIMKAHVQEFVTIENDLGRLENMFFMEDMKLVEPYVFLATSTLLTKKTNINGRRIGVIVGRGDMNSNYLFGGFDG